MLLNSTTNLFTISSQWTVPILETKIGTTWNVCYLGNQDSKHSLLFHPNKMISTILSHLFLIKQKNMELDVLITHRSKRENIRSDGNINITNNITNDITSNDIVSNNIASNNIVSNNIVSNNTVSNNTVGNIVKNTLDEMAKKRPREEYRCEGRGLKWCKSTRFGVLSNESQ